jgi:hypothetical protein
MTCDTSKREPRSSTIGGAQENLGLGWGRCLVRHYGQGDSCFAFFLQIITKMVEPRGFEPLTSAVQSQIHDVVVVRRCSKKPAK